MITQNTKVIITIGSQPLNIHPAIGPEKGVWRRREATLRQIYREMTALEAMPGIITPSDRDYYLRAEIGGQLTIVTRVSCNGEPYEADMYLDTCLTAIASSLCSYDDIDNDHEDDHKNDPDQEDW